MKQISEYAVYDGSELNVAATLAAIQTDLVAWDETNRADLETVLAAVHGVFDERKGAKINTPALKTLVLMRLNLTDPSSFDAIADRVTTVLKSSAFESAKGRNGGVCRVCDKPAETAK